MITWIKLEPVPLKEKIRTANIESQIDQMIAQIKRSYSIPEGMEIENGGDGVLIGSDSNDRTHEAAFEKIMLDYPTEWDKESKDKPALEEEAAFFDSSNELRTDYKKTVLAFDFINFYSIRRNLFNQIEEINTEIRKEIQKNLFTVSKDPKVQKKFFNVPKILTTRPLIPKEPAPELERAADFSTDLNKIEELYGWVFDNSSITSKLKPLFHILKVSSLSIPIYDFVNSFENAEFRDDLREFCIEENLYNNDCYLVWEK